LRLPFIARKRLATGAVKREGFWISLIPALSGALGTYTGWHAIIGGLRHMDGVFKIEVFSEGTYEANACRFLGFALSSILFVSLAAMPGLSGLAGVTTTLSGALGVRRRESIAASLGFVAIGVAATLLRAPSGAYIAFVAAAVVLASALLPTLHG